MKPLYILAAEERLKGQPKRHAKVFKGDISVFEADMIYIRDYLLSGRNQSLGKISQATGIPKATVQKMLSPKGIRRIYNLEQLERMKYRNFKRYLKIISGHTGVVKDGEGRWKGLEYRESDRGRFISWLLDQGYLLVDLHDKDGKLKYLIVEYPKDIKEEILALYTHRIMS